MARSATSCSPLTLRARAHGLCVMTAASTGKTTKMTRLSTFTLRARLALISGRAVRPARQVTFFGNPGIRPVYFTDWAGSDPVQELNWSPSQNGQRQRSHCRILQSHKNFLFALNGTTELDADTGVLTYYEDRVRWSRPCEPNGIPYTWQEPSEGV